MAPMAARARTVGELAEQRKTVGSVRHRTLSPCPSHQQLRLLPFPQLSYDVVGRTAVDVPGVLLCVTGLASEVSEAIQMAPVYAASLLPAQGTCPNISQLQEGVRLGGRTQRTQ